MSNAIRVEPGEQVDLASIDTKQDAGYDKDKALARSDDLGAELDELQELLFAAGTHSVLVVFQGMDTAGKDGVIRKVFRHVDPLGCRVWPFKAPTPLELAHDFLWRIHEKTPEKGYIAVFNRSHYEDVLIVRVDELVPEAVWRQRYEQINEFEELLNESQTIVFKFFLHVSRREQGERLEEREADIEKAYKLSAADWGKRAQWDEYQEAYTDAIERCSTVAAPWWIVPADTKWFRDMAVLETLVESLRPYRKVWLETLEARGKAELATIAVLKEAE